jgi:hypothetical protein
MAEGQKGPKGSFKPFLRALIPFISQSSINSTALRLNFRVNFEETSIQIIERIKSQVLDVGGVAQVVEWRHPE